MRRIIAVLFAFLSVFAVADVVHGTKRDKKSQQLYNNFAPLVRDSFVDEPVHAPRVLVAGHRRRSR